MTLGITLGVAGIGWGIYAIDRYQSEEQAAKEARYQAELKAERKRMAERHEAVAQSWVACVNALGLETCQLVQEWTLNQCDPNYTLKSCKKKLLER